MEKNISEKEAKLREQKLIFKLKLKETQNLDNGFAVVTEVAILSAMERLAKETDKIAKNKSDLDV